MKSRKGLSLTVHPANGIGNLSNMCRFPAIGLFLLFVALTARAADPATVSVDRQTLYEGDSATVTIQVPGAAADTMPDFTRVPDAQVRFLDKRSESRYQMSFANGRMQREGFSGTVYWFSVRPLGTGTHPGGAITVNADGRTQTLTLPPFTLLPTPPQDAVRLELLADRAEVLSDESFTVTLRLRVRRLAPPNANFIPFHPDEPPALSLPHLTGQPIEGLAGPDIRTVLQGWRQQGGSSGVFIESAPEDQDPMARLFNMGRRSTYLSPGTGIDLDGVPYLEFLFPVTFTARDEGAFTFGPATLRGKVLTGADPQGRPLVRDVYAVAPALTVRAVPPPADGRPPSFFGLSGSNLTADAQLNVSACRVGDPLKLTLSVRGPLNWQRATAPDIGAISNLTTRFRLYGSTMQTVKAGDGRDYSFTLRPLEPGTGEIPALPVSWYDTAAGTYKTVFTAPIPLKVDPSAELTAGTWADPTWNDYPSPETVSVAKSPAALRLGLPEPVRRPVAWMGWLAAGPLLLGLRLLGGRLLRLRAARRQAARPRHALDRALQALKRIRPGDPRRSAEAASLTLRTFAADWLNREPGGLTPPDWIRLLQERGVPPETATEFGDRMTRLFEAAYSPAPHPEVESEILPRLPDLLRRIGRPGSTGRPPAAALLALLSVISILGTDARAQDDGRGDFAWQEAKALAGRAADPASFREAARRYARLAEENGDSGEAFYNLGTCLLLAGEPKPALDALIRAERYWGRPPDLVHNMALARAALNGGDPVSEPWDRTVLVFHFGLPLDVRLRVALASFGLFWLLWALAWGRVRGIVKAAMALCLLAALLFGTSVAVTRVQEYQDEPLLPPPPGEPRATS